MDEATKATRIKASLFYTYCRDCFVATLLATPAQPFSRFFHHTAFAKQGNSTESSGEYVWAERVTQPPRRAMREWR